MTTGLENVARFAIAALLAGLWQAPIFALAAWLVLRIARSANATTRHSVLAVALFASLVLPVTTAGVATREAAFVPGVPVTPRVPFVAPATEKLALQSNATPTAPQSSGPSPFERFTLPFPRPLGIALFEIWLAGALFMLARLALALVQLERLKRDALPLSIDYREGLTRWSAAAKGSRAVRLCDSEEIDIPIAVGLFDAMILVPKHLIAELSAAQVDSIVLHELAHLRRCDDWFNAIERIASALLYFNPAIAWLCAQLDLEREVACDDWVLQQDEALPYATCLAQVAETAVWPRRPMTAPGAFITRRAMSIRIERLLAKQRDVRIHTSLVPAGSAFVVLAVLGLFSTIVSPSLAYDAGPVPATTAVPTVAPPAAPLPLVKSTNVHAEANDPSFIDELDKLGYKSISVDDLVSLRSIGVTTDYLRGLERAGVPRPSIEDLIEMRSLGIEPAYYRAMQARLPKLSVDELYGLRSSGVTPEYVDRLHHNGYDNITIDRLEEFEATGVTAEYLAGLAQAGYRNLSDDEIGQLHALGIDGAFVRKANGHGLHHLSVDDLTKLKASGVL